jgi:Membrane domain of glycerophosphoryl diester phosphodiesterase
MMATALRPLSTGELVDHAFSLYRKHFAMFLAIFGLPHLVVFAFQCWGLGITAPGRVVFFSLETILLSMVVGAASQAATVIAVSQVHLDRPAGVMDSFSRVKGEIFGVIGLTLAVGILVGLACIALIVPGILLAVRWSLAVPAKVLEGKDVGGAMSRSSELTKGSRGRIFVIWFLIIVLSFALSFAVRWPIEIAAGVKSLAALKQAAVGYRIAGLLATFISQCLVGPLVTIIFSLLYYDERVRKEAFDLQLMMQTLDAPVLQGTSA